MRTQVQFGYGKYLFILFLFALFPPFPAMCARGIKWHHPGQFIGKPVASLSQMLIDLTSTTPAIRAKAVAGLAYYRQSPAAVKLVVAMLTDADAGVRAAAAQSVAELDPAGANERLRPLLKDPAPAVRAAALTALLAIPNQQIKPQLLTAITDAAAAVRAVAARGLQRYRDREVDTALAKAAADPEATVRRWAVTALAAAPSALARKSLLAAYHDPETAVRAAVAKGLQAYPNDQSVIKTLLTLLDDPKSLVRTNTVVSLGILKETIAVPALLARLKDDSFTVRGQAAESLGVIGDPRLFPTLQSLAQKDEIEYVRMHALQALARLDNKRAYASIVHALDDADPAVRETAAELLETSDNKNAVSILVTHLNDTVLYVRIQVILALGRSQSTAAVPYLVTLYQSPDELSSTTAIDALLQMGEPAIPHLLAMVKTGTARSRAQLIAAFGKMKDPRITTALLSMIDQDNSDAECAMGPLVCIGPEIVPLVLPMLKTGSNVGAEHATIILTQFRTQAVPALMPLLTDQDPRIQLRAISALGRMQDPRAIPQIITFLGNADATIANMAEDALCTMGKAASAPLQEALHDKKAVVRRLAARSLGQIGDANAGQQLLGLVDDEAADVRAAAITSLGLLHEQGAVPAIIRLLPTETAVPVREAMAQALYRLNSSKVSVDDLRPLINDENPMTRRYAVQAAGQLHDPHFVPILTELLKDEHDEEVRCAILWAFGEIKDAKTKEVLQEQVKAESQMVRWTALIALGKMGDVQVLDQLIAAMTQIHSLISRDFIDGLGGIHDPKATDALIKALAGQDHGVREHAAKQLGLRKEVTAIQPLIKLLDDENPEVQRAAATAIGQLRNPQGMIPLIAHLMLADATTAQNTQTGLQMLTKEDHGSDALQWYAWWKRRH